MDQSQNSAQRRQPRSRPSALSKTLVELVGTLVGKVPVMSLSQVAKTWWTHAHHPEKAARAALRKLQDKDVIEIHQRMVHPCPEVYGPLARFDPPGPSPDLKAISARSRARWNTDLVRTTCVTASRRAALQCNGFGGRMSSDAEISHDILVAEVFLHYRREHREFATYWIGEPDIPVVEGQKTPDAMMDWGVGKQAVVEIVGQYTLAKLESFDADCRSRGLGYELW